MDGIDAFLSRWGYHRFDVDGTSTVIVSVNASEWRCVRRHDAEHLDGCGWVMTRAVWHVYSPGIGASGGRFCRTLPAAMREARRRAERHRP